MWGHLNCHITYTNQAVQWALSYLSLHFYSRVLNLSVVNVNLSFTVIILALGLSKI